MQHVVYSPNYSGGVSWDCGPTQTYKHTDKEVSHTPVLLHFIVRRPAEKEGQKEKGKSYLNIRAGKTEPMIKQG